MQLVDIIQTVEYDHLWNQCIEYITIHCKEDPLYENYIKLAKEDFVSLPVIIIDNQIVAFSGAQVNNESWGPNIARVSSRFWLAPDYRHSLTKFNSSNIPWYNSQFLIKHQLDILVKSGIPHMFISREGIYRKSFSKFIDLVNQYNNTSFKVLAGEYEINHIPQMIAVYSFETDPLEQWISEETLIKKL
jgi:glutaredoxin